MPNPAAADRPGPARPIVWIVDDSPTEAEAVRRALARDFEAVVFNDGSAVLERAARSALPEILVLDWLMPGVNGVEVCRYLRRENERIPVLVLTVQSEKTQIAEALAAGANDYLVKPFSPLELNARVRALIGSRRLFERAERAEHERAEAERLRAEVAEERARLNDLFLGIIGHDLRNPVATIHYAAEALGGVDHPDAKLLAEKIQDASQRMSEMITTLLDVTRARLGGGIPVQRVPTDLRAVCERVVGEVASAFPKRSIVLEAPRPVPLSADPNRLAQVLSNLVSNAFLHGDGQAPVRVQVSANAREAELVVLNEGPPIPRDVLPRMFQPLRRGGVPQGGQGGVRLGLYIAEQIVSAHGGRIEVSSGEVTAFTVRLPMP